MGRSLSCGIATKITILKRYNEENDMIIERIGKNIDLNIYERIDYDDEIVLQIKKDILEKYIVDFIVEQSKYCKDGIEKDTLDKLEKLKGLPFEKMKEVAREKYIYEFQFLEGSRVCNDISYLDPHGHNDIYCDIIDFIYLDDYMIDTKEFLNVLDSFKNNTVTDSEYTGFLEKKTVYKVEDYE